MASAVGGLATGYCVLATVLDACELGHRMTVLTDACRAVDLRPGDGDAALEQMQAGGTLLVTSHQIRSVCDR